MEQLSSHHRDISYVIHLLLGLLTAGLVALGLSADRWISNLGRYFESFARMGNAFSAATWVPIALTIAALFMISRLVYLSSVGRYISEHSKVALDVIAWTLGLASIVLGLSALHALVTGVFVRGAALPILTLIGAGLFGLLTVIPTLLARHHLVRRLEEGHFDAHGYPTNPVPHTWGY